MRLLNKPSLLLLSTLAFFGMTETANASEYGKGLRFDLDDSGDYYVKLATWHQIWARAIEMNPGTAGDSWGTDISLRRSRVLMMAKFGRLLALTHFGINNQSFVGGGASGTAGPKKPQLFFHDVWAQYTFIEDKLSFGAGLHYWNGISRLSNASTLNFLGIDAPISNWPTFEQTDQFARSMGMYLKGKLFDRRLDYRVALNKPFRPNGTGGAGTRSIFDPDNNTVSMAGYFAYHFLDIEANTVPFTVGTYLGKKRVFNLGAGALYHPEALYTLNPTEGRTNHDLLALGVDAFLDLPLGKDSGAITAYLAFYNYDFGPNHLRLSGINNFGLGVTGLIETINGPGNSYPAWGTGQIVYGQVGYMLPNLPLQPYATVQINNFDALQDIAPVIEGGMNWHLEGHHFKITANYRARPIMTSAGRFSKFASEVIMQTMIYL